MATTTWWDGTQELVATKTWWDGGQEYLTDISTDTSPAPGGGGGGAITTTLFGACPASGNTGEAGVTEIVTKYGADRTKTAVRQFRGAIGTPSKNAGIIHTSYKPSLDGGTTPDYAGIAAGNYDAAFTSLANNTPDGHVVEIYHEADHKNLNVAQTIAMKNRFYDRVKAANPKVLVAHTLTGWSAKPKSGYNLDQWGPCRADVFGIDCDGDHPTKLPYTAFDTAITSAVAFIDRWASSGYQYWAVPEFGETLTTASTNDPNHTQRAAWLTANAAAFKAAGALYVCAYEFNSTAGNEFTKPAEIAAWTAVMNGS